MKWAWKTSFLLVLLGATTAFFSLQSLHGQAVAKSLELQPPVDQKSLTPSQLIDARLPGSPGYRIGRARERLELVIKEAVNNDSPDLPKLKAGRAQDRLESSQYAWENQRVREAATTLHKSYIYLSEASNGWSNEDVEQLTKIADQLEAQLDDWQQHPEKLSTCELDLLEQLAQQAKTLRQQYQF